MCNSHASTLYHLPLLSHCQGGLPFPLDICIIALFVFDSTHLFQLIMELCCKQPDEEVIKPHLERLRVPTALSSPSAPTVVNKISFTKQKLQILLTFIAALHSAPKLGGDYRVKHHSIFDSLP